MNVLREMSEWTKHIAHPPRLARHRDVSSSSREWQRPAGRDQISRGQVTAGGEPARRRRKDERPRGHVYWPTGASNDAATPPGMDVVARVVLEAVEGRRLRFSAEVDDAADRICAGRHERFVVDRARFEAGVARKAEAAG